MLDGGVHVDGVPEHKNVHHEPERTELVFLAFPIALAHFPPAPMKDRPRQTVSRLLAVELRENPSSVGDAMEMLCDHPASAAGRSERLCAD